jgi:hypothetical protein
LSIHFFPKSCVQGLCVAAEKKERRKEQKNKTEEVPAVQKNLGAEKKVVVAETKERKSKKKKEKQKVSIRAAVLSLFCVTTFVSRLASLS